MPQQKSAKKRVKTGLRNQARNRALRSTLRTDLKRIVDMKDSDKEAAAREHQAVLDRAVKAGLVHKNKAARLKSRFRSSS